MNAVSMTGSGGGMEVVGGALVAVLNASTSYLATEKKGYKKSVDALCKKLLAAIEGDSPEKQIRLMHLSLEALNIAYTLADWGNASAATDAGVMAHNALAVLEGAALNALVNGVSLDDLGKAAHLRETVDNLRNEAHSRSAEVLTLVETRSGIR